jgi:hypothetical protein
VEITNRMSLPGLIQRGARTISGRVLTGRIAKLIERTRRP